MRNLWAMEVLVVRHAHAGTRQGWDGDDRLRPLSPVGAEDATALARVLETFEPRRVVSSALLRCVQTVSPLAAGLGLEVERSPHLAPDGGERAAHLVRGLGAGTGPVVVCTHGETIAAMRAVFARHAAGGWDGAAVAAAAAHAKGSVWVLRFDGGELREDRYLPPERLVGTG